jgi:hypothetical protein
MDPGLLYNKSACNALLQQYHDLLRAPWLPNRNPCPQPVSLTRADLCKLPGQYVVSDKSDGVRYTLFLTEIGGQAYSVLVDRKLALYQVPVAAAKSFYRGSIFDGELVTVRHGEGVTTECFLVFDVVVYKGEMVGDLDLIKRIEIVRTVFDLDEIVASPDDAQRLAKRGKVICGGSGRGLSFCPKPCYLVENLRILTRQIPTLRYPVDGLIFTPIRGRYGRGTDASLFKLKLKHTVDLEVCLRTRELVVGLGGGPETAVQRVPLRSFSDIGWDETFAAEVRAIIVESSSEKTAESLDSKGEVVRDQTGERVDDDPLIIECVLKNPSAPLLASPQRRRDKVHPNTKRTVLATLQNLIENLRPEEVLALVEAGGAHDMRDTSTSGTTQVEDCTITN